MPYQYRTDIIYKWVSPEDDDMIYFFSPDGEGRIFYDSLKEAKENSGLTSVLSIDILED